MDIVFEEERQAASVSIVLKMIVDIVVIEILLNLNLLLTP